MKQTAKTAFLILITLLAFSTCKNMFQVGLGEETDLEAPLVSLSSPDTGAFLTGTVTLRGRASDDRAIERVEISFDRGNTWRQINTYDPGTKRWEYQLDSTGFPDGRLIITIRATDSADRTTTTDNLVYNVDNNPPVVLVTEPRGFEQLIFNTEAVITVTAADVHAIRRFGSIVERSTDEGATWETIETSEVEQSTTWTKVFESDSYTSAENPEALFRFFVWAEDEAGNRSNSFYHFDTLRAASQRPWTADLLLSTLSAGTDPLIEEIRSSSFPENNTLDLFFDEDSDIPVIEWTSPSSLSDDTLPGIRSQGLLTGIFRDDDAIDQESAAIRIFRLKPDVTSNDWHLAESWNEEVAWTPPDLFTSDIRSVRWDYRMPADIGQGVFKAELRVSDIDGTPSNPFSKLFVIDDGSPYVEIDTPENIYFADDFMVTGIAQHSDPNLLSVLVSVGTGSASSPTWLANLENVLADFDAATQTWSISFDAVEHLSALPDGSVRIRARAVVGDSIDERQISLVRDTQAPQVGINTPNAASALNTIARAQGFSSDALSGVDGISVRLIDAPDPITAGDDLLSDWTCFCEELSLSEIGANGFAFEGVATNWTLYLDTRRFEDGDVTLEVRARDRAGNESFVERAFTIDQASNRPVLELSNIDIDGGRFDNVLSGEPRLIGNVTDDDAVNPDTFRYRVRPFGGTEDDWSVWRSVYETGERSATPRLDFNIPLLDPDNPSAFIRDGSSELQLWIEDTGNSALGIDPVGLTDLAPQDGGGTFVELSVDTGPPTITVSSPASGFITNSDFTISGSATDGFGIDRIEISFDGGMSYLDPPVFEYDTESNAPVTNEGFSFSAEIGAEIGGADVLTDGTYNIRVRARDLSGSVATENLTVTVDTQAPTIEFIRPDDGDTVNATVRIQGSANDNLQVATVYWYIGPEGEAPPSVPGELDQWNAFSNRYSWEYIWDTYAWQADPENQGTFDSATYQFHVAAVDTAANWSDITALTLTLDQESDRPTLEMSNLDINGSGLPDPIGTEPDNIFGANAVITGSVQDDDGIVGSGLTYRTRSWDRDADAGAGAYGNWSAGDDAEWTPVTNTFTSPRTNATWSQPVSTLGDGVHEIEFRVRDILFDSNRPLEDNFNWNTIGPVSFAINTANPQLTVSSGLAAAGTTFVGDDRPFSGNASDVVGVHSVTASFVRDTDPDDVTQLTVNFDQPNDSISWETTFPVGLGEPEQLADGDYTVTITATDRLGRTGSISRAVYIDTEAPTITVGNLSENALVTTADFTINGTADDGSGSGVDLIEYSLDAGTTWEEATGTPPAGR